MTLENIINWLALLIAIALIVYGIVGLASGKVTASSYAFNTKRSYTGPGAVALSICWIAIGLVGATAFGGHILGIAQVSFLYDFCQDLLKSN